MAIDNSILGMKLENPFGIDSPPVLHARARVPILLSPRLPATCYPRPGLLATANFSASIWRHG